jgi:UDP-glucose 4-epimerase
VLALLAYQGSQRIFNVSSGKGHSVLDIVAILGRHLNALPEVVHSPDRGFDVPINVLDSSMLCAETGWFPKVDLETGIARTIESLRVSQRPGAGR